MTIDELELERITDLMSIAEQYWIDNNFTKGENTVGVWE